MSDILFTCPNCKRELGGDTSDIGVQAVCPACEHGFTVPGQTPKKKIVMNRKAAAPPPPPEREDYAMSNRYTQYKLISVSEGALGTIFAGSSALPVMKIQDAINKEAKAGWQVVFQVIEQKRMLIFWQRETMLITLGK